MSLVTTGGDWQYRSKLPWERPWNPPPLLLPSKSMQGGVKQTKHLLVKKTRRKVVTYAWKLKQSLWLGQGSCNRLLRERSWRRWIWLRRSKNQSKKSLKYFCSLFCVVDWHLCGVKSKKPYEGGLLNFWNTFASQICLLRKQEGMFGAIEDALDKR